MVASEAQAGELSLGVGVEGGLDLADRQGSEAWASFGPGLGLALPVRYSLGERADLRATVRGNLASGADRVTWQDQVPGVEGAVPVQYASEEHWAMQVGAGLTVGLDTRLKDEGLQPYLGAELGPFWVLNYHSFGASSGTQALLSEYSDEELANANTVEPHTSTLTLWTDLHAGGRLPLGDGGLDLWFETGYSTAFVGARPLTRTDPAISAQREAYGWNAIRLGVGVAFAL